MLLKDRVALVTGASRGIGAAISRKFAEEGAAVGVNYFQSQTAALEVVQQIEAAGGRAAAVQADSRNRDQVEAMVSAVEEALGAIDILVVNASMTFPTKPFLNYEWGDFEAKLVGEIASAYHVCRAVVPSMVKRGGGSVIAVSSTLSRVPGPGFVAHATAKSALDSFVKSLALELGPVGVRVNTVAPGLTETDATAHIPAEMKDAIAKHTPLGRCAQPEDIAGVATFLASDLSQYLTGAYIPASGGTLMP